jgi:hypothetical protein
MLKAMECGKGEKLTADGELVQQIGCPTIVPSCPACASCSEIPDAGHHECGFVDGPSPVDKLWLSRVREAFVRGGPESLICHK